MTYIGSVVLQNCTKNDEGAYKCIANQTGTLSMTESKLEVIDVTYLPEVDDLTVFNPFGWQR